MLNFTFNIDPRLEEIDLEDAVQKSLTQAWYLVSGDAKQNAPYRSWNLRRWILPDFTQVTHRKVTVWSNVKYARIQELWGRILPKKSNYLTWKSGWRWYRAKEVNIKGKFFMLRALNENKQNIYNTFLKNITNEL